MNIGLRVQGLPPTDKTLVMGRLAEATTEGRGFSPKSLEESFAEAAIPMLGQSGSLLRSLKRSGLVINPSRGRWQLTPRGRARVSELVSDIDLAALAAEAVAENGSFLGRAQHSVLPPSLAPPSLLRAVKDFLLEHPFENNVLAMTRFPDRVAEGRPTEALAECIDAAREVCRLHGLEMHLASDRAIDDDLWTNVAAHMWSSHYGIAFFEDTAGRGLNYNLTIEVGSMLMTGRRCALLKDISIESMPTDLVGRIYREVDVGTSATVKTALHEWLREDLGLGACKACS